MFVPPTVELEPGECEYSRFSSSLFVRAVELARARGVEMPITAQMDAILNQGKSARDAIRDLMTRSAKSETM